MAVLVLFLLIFFVFFVFSLIFRLIVTHPYSTIYYALWDLYSWIALKGGNNAPYGSIICYIAYRGTAFGTGKTLSATKSLVDIYNRYNGVTVYCPRRKRFVSQRIHILSNVDFQTIPFERLSSLSQFVKETDEVTSFDDAHDCLSVFYVLIDEASSQLNSRSFKSNFDAPFISRLLTARHVRANLILTSQRSGMVDKLMRDCCNYYIACQKIWRFEILRWYDAYSIESAQEPNSVAPIKRTAYFISDKLFDNYDTFASVQALKKSCQEGDMLSEEEIMNLRVGDSMAFAKDRKSVRKNKRKNKKSKS